MSLIAIKQHMMQVRIASLNSLCSVFATDAETMRCQLSHWLQKGRIKQCVKTSGCGTKCFKCPVGNSELYEWLDVGQ